MGNRVAKIEIPILVLLFASVYFGQAYAQSFGSWDSWDGTSCSNPVAIWGGGQVSGQGDRLNLFVRSCDGGIHWRFSPDGSYANLGPWQNLGGLFDGDPAVVTIRTPSSTGLDNIYAIVGGRALAVTIFLHDLTKSPAGPAGNH